MVKNQYCRVGVVNSISLSNSIQRIHILEYQYQNFLEKASSTNDARLIDFFELKARKIKKALENIM